MNSLAQHLAVEEPDIASVSVGPGRVDTDMQKVLRESGAPGVNMTAKDHAGFVSAFEEGKLNKPEWPGQVIAALAVEAKTELAGKYYRYAVSYIHITVQHILTIRDSWNSPELAQYRRET
jgi:hypothetical protein